MKVIEKREYSFDNEDLKLLKKHCQTIHVKSAALVNVWFAVVVQIDVNMTRS
mgnify:CR=1 FL=1